MGRVLIIGASGGIGAALSVVYSNNGDEVVGLSRSMDGFDITDEARVRAQLLALSGNFDTILCATGQLAVAGRRPEKALGALDAASMVDLFKTNAVGPALILKHTKHLLPRNRPVRFGILSARVGSIGDNQLGGWYSYRASKAALNQLVRCAAIEIARTHKQVVICALHPGTVATSFTQEYQSRHPTSTPLNAAIEIRNTLEGLPPAETGSFWDYRGNRVPW
ncbi:MAG: SDR family NAD(P)-dependent oxidoreductase [Pseudoruegeria sp.]